MKLLIDTSGYSQMLAGDTSVARALDNADTVLLSSIVIGELLAGFKKGTRERENRTVLHRFILKPSVRLLSISPDTSEFYARVHDDLRKAGTPIPTNDEWIAAQALENGAAVISFDGHFLKVPGLIVYKT
jgi:tRNA(fMet)-specific endonuclease VapC